MAIIVGQVLNERYEILEKIGEGGMAIAYRGRDRVLGRAVAIKIMRPELATDAGFLARFRREARAAAGITHEHIAAVYDTGSDGPYHYIVMEYVAGESLHDRLRREGALPLDQALRIAGETAEALEAAHSAGVVHRDIKPHNILLSREGHAKVTDFGIARAASAPGGGDTSAVIGSVNYVSPEQARGETVGPQGDIYSLGATLFEMLTGKPPFNGGDRLAILHKHVYDRAPRPSDSRSGLPSEVDSLVAHCLEKDLSRRFASARELRTYLAACPDQEDPTAVRARGRGPWRVARGWGLPRSVVLWVSIGALLIAASIGAIAFRAASRGRQQMVGVPDIVGMNGLAAKEMLIGLGLGYREIGARPSNDMTEGAVLTQDPTPGRSVGRDTLVKVVLSEGAATVEVPDVTEMSVAAAQRNLEKVNLTAGTVTETYNDQVPAGYVAGTLPAAGARVAPGTTVDIVLSLGTEPPIPGSGDISPTAPEGRDETLTFTVPQSDTTTGPQTRPSPITVRIVVQDDSGSRTIYQASHVPGRPIPPQKIHISSPTTASIYLNGKLEATRHYLP